LADVPDSGTKLGEQQLFFIHPGVQYIANILMASSNVLLDTIRRAGLQARMRLIRFAAEPSSCTRLTAVARFSEDEPCVFIDMLTLLARKC